MAHLGSILVAMVMLCITHAQEEPTVNVMTKYFGSHSFLCNNNATNLNSNNRPNIMYWMLPNGKLVSAQGHVEKDTMVISEWMGLAYNLTLTRITDEDFGYYTCILHYNTEVKVVRWGLNLNGPDYSDLREHYRMSAITGAIAAAVLLAVVGLGCVIWHYRFSKRSGKEVDGPGSDYIYDNTAAVALDDVEVKKQPANGTEPAEAANGPSSTTIDVKL